MNPDNEFELASVAELSRNGLIASKTETIKTNTLSLQTRLSQKKHIRLMRKQDKLDITKGEMTMFIPSLYKI